MAGFNPAIQLPPGLTINLLNRPATRHSGARPSIVHGLIPPAAMTSSRILGLSYLATATLFTLAIFFSDHAALRMVADKNVQAGSRAFQGRVLMPALQFARLEDEKLLVPQVAVPLIAPGLNDARTLAHAAVPPMP